MLVRSGSHQTLRGGGGQTGGSVPLSTCHCAHHSLLPIPPLPARPISPQRTQSDLPSTGLETSPPELRQSFSFDTLMLGGCPRDTQAELPSQSCFLQAKANAVAPP